MIVSASRRTDIPALYSEWFLNRLKEGYALVRNPFNFHLVSRVSLRAGDAEFIVFWTKNPKPMLPGFELLERFEIPYYFLYTVTLYGKPLERNLPAEEEVLDTFRRLSEGIGVQRTVWRYDPVIITDEYDAGFHERRFEYISRSLENRTTRCIVSFIDMYRKCERNLKDFSIHSISNETKIDIMGNFNRIADRHGIAVQSCAEETDLSSSGVQNGKCIDDELISEIIGESIAVSKDLSQRKHCRCVKSIDIGSYNTCTNGCLYCYANSDLDIAAKNYQAHNPTSPLIYGTVEESDRIVDRAMSSIFPMKRRDRAATGRSAEGRGRQRENSKEDLVS